MKVLSCEETHSLENLCTLAIETQAEGPAYKGGNPHPQSETPGPTMMENVPIIYWLLKANYRNLDPLRNVTTEDNGFLTFLSAVREIC